MRRPLPTAGALVFIVVGAALLSACGRQPAAMPPSAVHAETTPTVGDTVSLPVGDVTLRSATSTPPADWKGTPVRETLWLHFEFRNTTDSSVTVRGFRGAPRPRIQTARGARIYASGEATRFVGGTGGWGLGQDGVRLDPGGVIYASFGLRPGKGQYVPGKSLLIVSWRPAGDEDATFEVR